MRQPHVICLPTDSDTFTPSEVSFLSAVVWSLCPARHNKDVSKDKRAVQKLPREVKKAKRTRVTASASRRPV